MSNTTCVRSTAYTACLRVDPARAVSGGMELDSPTIGLIGASVNADNTSNKTLTTRREEIGCTSDSFGASTALNPRESQRSPPGHAVPAPVGKGADRQPSDDKVPRYKRPCLQAWEDALIQGIETFSGVEEVVQETMIGKILVVREERWYPVFMKDRWIGYNDKALDSGAELTLENGVNGTVWSADDPAVWRELRPCIELASRILGQAVRGPWCVPLYFGSSEHH